MPLALFSNLTYVTVWISNVHVYASYQAWEILIGSYLIYEHLFFLDSLISKMIFESAYKYPYSIPTFPSPGIIVKMQL